eukprot:CAMPEP_0173393832 /NCGR_PEP_ID=MMETSP1356-20130122/22339_1 /TAXON_ID=77927 ORGANISM="Hemiselmis virescens, Strain PCC157" /NCGR_SAMPLE_ID=MMETSP1356 /ASSEMBLY_ACC=CAM_ASM_000847 /LENGTH=322 /DNA_ID=CAMNT_0014351913 /DNA_START=69 /DNA_END=1034 /DNA_ORIENTATION=-
MQLDLTQADYYHVGYGAAVYLVSVASVALINNHRSKHGARSPPPFGWIACAHWAFMLSLMFASMSLDHYFPACVYLIGWKAAANAYAYAALDYWLSTTLRADALNTLKGSLVWQAMFQFTLYNLRNVWGGDHLVVRQADASPLTFLGEYGRLGHYLAFAGILTDLIFSPMHRLTHHRKLYKWLHKGHHAATNQLSGLELYRGELADDVMMAGCVTVATYLLCWAMQRTNYTFSLFSNTSWYLNQYFLVQSHASDARVANLLAPLPEALNFAAYHHVHHVDPSLNYGLTLPSDMVWDALLGVRTIVLPTEFRRRQAEKRAKAG